VEFVHNLQQSCFHEILFCEIKTTILLATLIFHQSNLGPRCRPTYGNICFV